MWKEAAVALVAGLLPCACGSTWVSIGPDGNNYIRGKLESGKSGSMVLLAGERSYWIGPEALSEERRELFAALVHALPTADRYRPGDLDLPHTRGLARLTLADVGQDDVIAYYHLTGLLDIEFGDSFVRVLQIPTRSASVYELWTPDPQSSRASVLMIVKSSPTLDGAWDAFLDGAAASAGTPFGAAPFVARMRGAPMTSHLRDVGVDFNGITVDKSDAP